MAADAPLTMSLTSAPPDKKSPVWSLCVCTSVCPSLPPTVRPSAADRRLQTDILGGGVLMELDRRPVRVQAGRQEAVLRLL